MEEMRNGEIIHENCRKFPRFFIPESKSILVIDFIIAKN